MIDRRIGLLCALLLAACKKEHQAPPATVAEAHGDDIVAKALAAIQAQDADAWTRLQGFSSEGERQNWLETSAITAEVAGCRLTWSAAKQVSETHDAGEHHYVFEDGVARMQVDFVTSGDEVVDSPICLRVPLRPGAGFGGTPLTIELDHHEIGFIVPPSWKQSDGRFEGPAGVWIEVRFDCNASPTGTVPMPCTDDAGADVLAMYEAMGIHLTVEHRDADGLTLQLADGGPRLFVRTVSVKGWGRATCTAAMTPSDGIDPAVFDDVAALCRPLEIQ